MNVSSGLGALLSAVLFGGIFIYYFIKEKHQPVWPLIILGLCYFCVSVFQFSHSTTSFFSECIKYFIFVVTVGALTRNTKYLEMNIFLLVGGISIIVNAVMFSNMYGRYSGFYINPNTGGLITLLGYSLAFTIKDLKIRLIFQFILIIGGIMTLSRYFMLMLVIVTLISMIQNRYNALAALIGTLAFVFVITSGDFKLNSSRFRALESIFSDDVDTETITKESRDETWALYKEPILNSPIFGNGYQSFRGHEQDDVGIKVGVHNTYLMVIGEAGIIPFIILIIIYFGLLIKSLKYFLKTPQYLYISLVLLTYLMVSHNYFDNYIVLFFTIWLYETLKKEKEEELKETINE